MSEPTALPHPRGQSDSPDDWSIADCMRIVWRRKAAFLWITCMVGLGAVFITCAQPRIYRSRASVEVQTLNEDFLNVGTIYPVSTPKIAASLYAQTQAELLQQDSLLEEIARKLHLLERPEFQPPPTLLWKLRQDVRIVPIRNTRIIQIVCDAREASLSADLANTLAQTFIEQSVQTWRRGARQTYESLQLQIKGLNKNFLQQGARVPAPPGSHSASNPLAPASRANEQIYESILAEANNARMASVVYQSNVRLISPAEPATRPYKPNLPLNLAIGMIGGIVLAAGFLMLHEQKRQTLRAPGEARTYLSLPELGAIPEAGLRTQQALYVFVPSRGKIRVATAVLAHSSSSPSESFRCALTCILSRTEDAPHTLLVTSSLRREGKTTTVSNLGAALAEIGRKTLLIDGDMRHPQLHRIFGQPNGSSLSDFLREGRTAEDIPMHTLVKRTLMSHLYLLPIGAYSENTFRFLYSSEMSRLFQRFRDEFDYVLVDTPPCLEFVDSRIMAQYAEGVVLVVRADHTDRRTVQACARLFQGDGARIIGILLNRWKPYRGDV